MIMTSARIRLGALALALAGVLFVLYPAFRPWHDESTRDGAVASMSSSAWVTSHLFAMIAFILVPLGLLAVFGLTRSSLALWALVTAWIGGGLTLTYYGGEDFALNAIAAKASTDQKIDILALTEAFRYHPVAITVFAAGLLILAVSGVLTAIAVWRSGTISRYSGLLFAIGLVLFLPQFFTPAPVRIGHGVLLGIGALWLAYAVNTSSSIIRRPASI